MVAWIIALFTAVFGHTEFAVRFGAILSWGVMGWFIFALVRDLYGRNTAFVTLFFIASFPFFFGVGMFMAPDAPLAACWAGTLYFLERALISNKRSAWWGVGVCAGLGLLSKYTIALLAPATLLFMAVDPASRRWLRRKEPYLTVALALAIFSPVILWNTEHGWVSFVFQGPRRFASMFGFYLPQFLGHLIAILSPTGLLAAFLAVFAVKSSRNKDQRYRFCAIITLVPVCTFFIFSLFHEVELNWSGPAWLALVPLMAHQVMCGFTRSRAVVLLRRAWVPTVVIIFLLFGATLHYATLGLPLLGYPQGTPVLGWSDLARQVEEIEDGLEATTGCEPLVLGMDKHRIASELAFYRTKFSGKDDKEREGIIYTAGPNFFGKDSLMYKYWFPEGKGLRAYANVLLLVGKSPEDLSLDKLAKDGWRVEEVKELTVRKDGAPVGHYYYAVARVPCTHPEGVLK
jgi:dolichol-phosphate mannosyltransferase